MLYGDSGNGKSSLINAGLLPEVVGLGLGFSFERVRVQPRAGEEIVVERIATDEDRGGGDYLPSLLAAPDDASPQVVLSTEALEERLRAGWADHRPIVVFDQFEELLTLFEDPAALALQQRVVDLIVRLLHDPLPIKVVLSFREDHLGRVKQLLAAAPELVDQALRLGPPSEEALPTIIRGPFERYPGHFDHELEPALAERLRAVLADRFSAGELSLSEVQTVCLRLWQSGDPRTLLETRGVQGILEDYLGEELDAFPPEQRIAAVSLLAQMVTSSGTRNVISADDLLHRVREEEDIPERRLEQALERLESESKLVRRERRRDIDLYEITSEFLVPWISQRRIEARRQQDRRRERRRAAAFVAAGAILAAIAVWALGQRSDARREAKVSAALALAATSASQLQSQPDAALLLALDGYRRVQRPATRSGLISALQGARGSGVLGILHGHSAPIFSVAFGPDGRTLASGSDDGTVRLWDTRTNKQLGDPLTGHDGTVYGVAFSPDGRRLATSGADHTVRLWDVAGRREVARLEGHTGLVFSAVFSRDGRTLVSASQDRSVLVWDARDGRRLAGPLRHPDSVQMAAVSPDGATIASACRDGKVRLWDARTGELVGEPLARHTGEVVDVAFSPDGRRLASASFDDTVRLWDARTRRPLARLAGHSNAVYSVAFSPDGQTLASASSDRTIRRWNVASGRPAGAITGHVGTIFTLAFSADGRRLASGSNDATVRVADATAPGPLTGHRKPVRSVAFSRDGRSLVSGSNDRRAMLWDARTHRRLGTLKGSRGSVVSTAFSGDGRLVATGDTDSTVRLWDASTRRPLRTFEGHDGDVFGVAVSRDGRTVASAGEDFTVRLWPADGSRPRVLRGHRDKVYAVAFGPGGTVVSGGRDKRIRFWDAATGRPDGSPLPGHTDWIFSLALTRDGRTLASGAYDNTVRLWDARTRRPIGALRGHTGPVYSVAFSPDGRYLVSASEDDTTRVWDLATRRQIGSLAGNGRTILAVDFAPDGTLAVAGRDTEIRLLSDVVWSDFAAIQRTVCALMGGELSRAEWERAAPDIDYGRSCS